ncbi:MAG: lipoate--protein ligase family protein [Candidatus Gastranaerophilales bacterium]|nr:lipoate--protein ligase family protein [Candidatus Gastranaerophilales bacterium]
MKFIEYTVNNGQTNMNIDSELLENAIKTQTTEPIFRLYGWKPYCISLGRNQNDDFIKTNILKQYDIDCVRRLTGGRALFHANELTYSYITPISIIKNGENVTESYKAISSIWIDIFNKLGIELTIGGLPKHITKNNYCMSVSTGADLCWHNKKFIGSAQCRKNGYILQHGSILLDYDKNILDEIFNEQTDYNTIVSLKQINPNLNINSIIGAVNKYLLN